MRGWEPNDLGMDQDPGPAWMDPTRAIQSGESPACLARCAHSAAGVYRRTPGRGRGPLRRLLFGVRCFGVPLCLLSSARLHRFGLWIRLRHPLALELSAVRRHTAFRGCRWVPWCGGCRPRPPDAAGIYFYFAGQSHALPAPPGLGRLAGLVWAGSVSILARIRSRSWTTKTR